MKEYDRFFSELRKYSLRKTREEFEERDVQIPSDVELDAPLCKTFQVYMYPAEIDYYDEQTKEHHQLWQIDSPLFKERIPKPYELPEEFGNLPETKTVFVSLGSVFSIYIDLLQRLVDALDKVPGCKFIVSNGDKVKLPSKRFIGQAWFDQLAVLQVCDAMVAHGMESNKLNGHRLWPNDDLHLKVKSSLLKLIPITFSFEGGNNSLSEVDLHLSTSDYHDDQFIGQ